MDFLTVIGIITGVIIVISVVIISCIKQNEL